MVFELMVVVCVLVCALLCWWFFDVLWCCELKVIVFNVGFVFVGFVGFVLIVL